MTESPDLDRDVRAKPPRHIWAKAEVRFALLFIVVLIVVLALAHVMNFRVPAKGPPIGTMAPTPANARSTR